MKNTETNTIWYNPAHSKQLCEVQADLDMQSLCRQRRIDCKTL